MEFHGGIDDGPTYEELRRLQSDVARLESENQELRQQLNELTRQRDERVAKVAAAIQSGMQQAISDGIHLLGGGAERNTCKRCGGTRLHMRNFDPRFRDGDLHCDSCGDFVRGYDAG